MNKQKRPSMREQRDELAAVVREMVAVLATERRTEFRQRWLDRARAALSGLAECS